MLAFTTASKADTLWQMGWVLRFAQAVKYETAVEWLIKDRDGLLAFYDFSAETLETSAYDQRHRKLVRNNPPSHGAQ
jgi:hypothetical protein